MSSGLSRGSGLSKRVSVYMYAYILHNTLNARTLNAQYFECTETCERCRCTVKQKYQLPK